MSFRYSQIAQTNNVANKNTGSRTEYLIATNVNIAMNIIVEDIINANNPFLKSIF